MSGSAFIVIDEDERRVAVGGACAQRLLCAVQFAKLLDALLIDTGMLLFILLLLLITKTLDSEQEALFFEIQRLHILVAVVDTW
jgi:hypothetical protein